jgi:hypothetical protein
MQSSADKKNEYKIIPYTVSKIPSSFLKPLYRGNATTDPVKYLSDHDLVVFPEQGIMNFNMLKMSAYNAKFNFYNNAFDAVETLGQYKARALECFQYVAKKIDKNSHFVAFQEITTDAVKEGNIAGFSNDDLTKEVGKFGFKQVSKAYSGGKDKLMIAYNPAEMEVVQESYDIKSLSEAAKKAGYVQAVKFKDKFQQEFLVVNVHLGWSDVNVMASDRFEKISVAAGKYLSAEMINLHKAANKAWSVVKCIGEAIQALDSKGQACDSELEKKYIAARAEQVRTRAAFSNAMEICLESWTAAAKNDPAAKEKLDQLKKLGIALPGALNDVRNLLDECESMPVFVLGDFNKGVIRLNSEAGVMIVGENANIATLNELDSCDNLIKNVKACEFLQQLNCQHFVATCKTVEKNTTSLRQYREDIESLIKLNLLDYVKSNPANSSSIILKYLFVCDFKYNHSHDLQEGAEFFDVIAHREKHIDDIFLVLNSIKNPYFNLVIGGGAALNRCFAMSHRFHEDCDFEIVRNAHPIKSDKTEVDELDNFKQVIKDTLSAMPAFKVSDQEFYTRGGKRFFTFNLNFDLNISGKKLVSVLALSFVHTSINYHLQAYANLPVLRYSKLREPRIFTADLIDITSGKLVSLIVDDGVFPRSMSKHPPLMKNFFDLYLLWPILVGNKAALFESIKKTIAVTRLAIATYYLDFYNDPYGEILKAVNVLKSQQFTQFGEESDLAKRYYHFLQTEVYVCEAPIFIDTVNTLIDIFSEFLKHCQYSLENTVNEIPDSGVKHYSDSVHAGSFAGLFVANKQLPVVAEQELSMASMRK